MYGRYNEPTSHRHSPLDTDLAGASEGGFDPKKIWGVFLRRWKIVVGALTIALLWAGIWLVQVTPLYTATAQLLLDSRKLNVTPGQDVLTGLGLNKAGMATEMALVRSHSVARRVVSKLGLAKDPEFASLAPRAGLMASLGYFFTSLISSESDADDMRSGRARPGEAASPVSAKSAQSLYERIAIARVRGGIAVKRFMPTYIIRIAYTHSNPAKAAIVANGVAAAYLDEQLEARYLAAKRAADWLSERVVTVRQQLEASEMAVAEHRVRHALAGTVTGTLSDQQAAAINAQLVEARAVTVQKKAKYDEARKVLKSGRIATVAVVLQSATIATLRGQELEIRRKEADLLTRYGAEHPKIVTIRAERRDLKQQIRRELARVVSTLKTDYEFALKKEQSLKASLGQLTGAGGSGNAAIIRLRELTREAEANNTLYQSLLSRLKEAEQQSSLPTGQSRVTTPAVRPGVPSYPNTKRILILAVFGGLAFGFAGAFLLEFIESGFLTIEQVENTLRIPVIAMVPHLTDSERTVNGNLLSIPDYVEFKPLSGFGESIRTARVTTQMSDIDCPPKLVMVASALPSEGKTTLAMSLAYSAAASNKRVMLIDCDLRHPSLSSHFGLNDRPGLTDLLTGQAPAEQVFVTGSVPGLTIIPAGTTTRHPPDVLNSDRLKEFLKVACENNDLVMIDAPPVMPVIDAVILSRIVEKVVYVLQWRTTPRDVVARAIASLDDSRDKIVGVMLNNAQSNKLSTYATYYNYFHKRYQKYYSD